MKQRHPWMASALRFTVSAAGALAFMVPVTSYGADFGTIKGRITDKSDGEGVYGASVTVNGTTIGTATDMEGNFVLRDVPAKAQKITVSIVGYTPAVQTVTVSPDQTYTIDLSLAQTTIMASEVVVGAALYEQDRLEVPVTACVVCEEAIKQEPSASLDRVIEGVPGVVVNRSAGMGTATVQIRGSNAFQGGGIGTRVQGLYDGYPVNTPVTGEIVWHNINMNAADKVEVLKGAAATLYGSGAMGGVVNVQGALPDKFEVVAGASRGSYDDPPTGDRSSYYEDNDNPWFWNSYIGVGNKTGPLSYSVIYSHGEDDGYKENAQYTLDDIKLKARYDIDARQYVQISSFYSETKAGYAQTWPFSVGAGGALTPMPEYAYDQILDNNPESWYDGVYSMPADADSTGWTASDENPYDDDVIRRKNALVGINYVNMLSDDVSLDTRLYYTRNENLIEYNPDGDVEALYFTGAPIPVTFRVKNEFNQDISDRFGAGAKVDYRLNDQHRLLFGIDGNLTAVESTQYTDEIPDFHPNTDDALHGIQERNLALFLQDEIKVSDRLTALASVRYDWHDISADNVTYYDYSQYDGTDASGSDIYGTAAGDPPATIVNADIENNSVDAISPRLALNYKATDNTALRASWSRSFRAPTLSERFVRDAGQWDGNPNPELDKETLTAYEIGVFSKLSDRVSIDVAAYLNYYDDLIESQFVPILEEDGITESGSTYFTYTNLNEARIWGIETALNIMPIDPVNVALTYSYMNAKDTDYEEGVNTYRDNNPDPEWLPYRPEHTASASVSWQATDKLTLNTTGRYVGEYKAVSAYTNEDGDNYPGDFVVFNIGAKYQLTSAVAATFLCKNINNTQYEEAEWFRAPGRSFMLGVDFKY